MPTQDDLMSFLASASRHVPVNQEGLADSLRQGYNQVLQEQGAQEPQEQQENELEESIEVSAEAIQELEEQIREQANEELVRYAMQNLGLNATNQSPSTEASSSTDSTENTEPESQEMVAPPEVVEAYLRFARETQGQPEPEPEPEQEPPQDDTPVNERPIQVPAYSTVREELVRFSDAEWFNKVQEKVIVLAGVGGIGSNMAVILAKLNPSAIYIFDDDLVESFNLAGQFYSNEDIGKPKVEALAASVNKYTNYSSIFALNRRFMTGEEVVADIMICGFDNMRARKDFFAAWKSHVMTLSEERRKDCLFIDGRLTADEFQIFCITGIDDFYMDNYVNNYLFNDYEAQRETCSYKQTGFLADMIGAFMVNLVVNFCANQVNPRRNMTLPFMTSYRSSIMFLDFKR